MLVPDAFAVHANAIWTAMGSPKPHFHNAWAIYLQIRDTLKGMQHGLGSFLSGGAQPSDHNSDDMGDISLLLDWDDFSDDNDSDGAQAIAGPSSPMQGPMADITEEEDDTEGNGIGLA